MSTGLGFVVDHKESGVRFAISEANFNPKLHKRVRDLKPGETVRGYAPKPRQGGSGDVSTDSADSQPETGK